MSDADATDAFGDPFSAHIPALLTKLASGRKAQRERAFAVLADERLVHQGTRWPAALPAVPLLLGDITTEKHPGRALVLRLLAIIAAGSPGEWLRAWPAPPVAALAADASLAGACFRAVAAGCDAYEALLDHPDAGARQHAAAPLALVAPARCVAAVLSRLPSEENAEVAIGWLEALALAAKLLGQMPSPASPPEVGPRFRGDERVRAALAIARMHASGTWDDVIAGALVEPLARVATPLGTLWDGAIGASVAAGVDGRRALAGALSVAANATGIANALVAAVLPGDAEGGQGVERPPLRSPSSFSPEVLDVVRLAVDKLGDEWQTWLLRAHGLPSWIPDLRRYLGMDPKGVLERAIPWRGRAAEAAVVLDGVACGVVEEQEAREAFRGGFAVDERVEFAIRAASDCYGVHQRKGWPPERSVRFAVSLLDDDGCLPALEARVAAFDPRDHAALDFWGRFVVLRATHALRARRGASFLVGIAPLLADLAPAAWGDLVEHVRVPLADAPAALRDGVALALDLPAFVDQPGRMGAHTKGVVCAGWSVLDLAADREAAARRGVESVAAWQPLAEPVGTGPGVWDAALGRWVQAPNARDHVVPREAAERALRSLLPESRHAYAAFGGRATLLGREVLETLRAP